MSAPTHQNKLKDNLSPDEKNASILLCNLNAKLEFDEEDVNNLLGSLETTTTTHNIIDHRTTDVNGNTPIHKLILAFTVPFQSPFVGPGNHYDCHKFLDYMRNNQILSNIFKCVSYILRRDTYFPVFMQNQNEHTFLDVFHMKWEEHTKVQKWAHNEINQHLDDLYKELLYEIQQAPLVYMDFRDYTKSCETSFDRQHITNLLHHVCTEQNNILEHRIPDKNGNTNIHKLLLAFTVNFPYGNNDHLVEIETCVGRILNADIFFPLFLRNRSQQTIMDVLNTRWQECESVENTTIAYRTLVNTSYASLQDGLLNSPLRSLQCEIQDNKRFCKVVEGQKVYYTDDEGNTILHLILKQFTNITDKTYKRNVDNTKALYNAIEGWVQFLLNNDVKNTTDDFANVKNHHNETLLMIIYDHVMGDSNFPERDITLPKYYRQTTDKIGKIIDEHNFSYEFRKFHRLPNAEMDETWGYQENFNFRKQLNDQIREKICKPNFFNLRHTNLLR